MTIIAASSVLMSPARARASAGHARRLVALVHDLRRRWRQRRELSMMDDIGLRDLSLSAADADRELAKPFWTALSVPGRD